MHVNLSSDRLLHLLVLIIASAFFGFVVQYWTESGLLFSFSGGVTIAVQLSNVIEKFRNPPESTEGGQNEVTAEKDGNEGVSGEQKRPNKKQMKSVQRRRGHTTSAAL